MKQLLGTTWGVDAEVAAPIDARASQQKKCTMGAGESCWNLMLESLRSDAVALQDHA